MLKHFLLGAIRRVFRPGSKYEEMLCLVGGQGAGKSTFFRLLAIRDEWFSDDLKKLDDDRAGNRRFLPIMIYPENAEVHILEDEDASRDYLLQVWAEAMSIYRSGRYSMKFSKSIQHQLVEVQKDFMPEDT